MSVAALEYHLTHNHYPPVDLRMIPACEQAIAAVRRGDPDHVVGITPVYSEPAWEIVENLHLDDFVHQPTEQP